MTIIIPLLILRCIANAKSIPVIILVKIIFRKYKKVWESKKIQTFEKEL